jgi:hypothetical protein
MLIPAELRQTILYLLGIDLVGSRQPVNLFMTDIAARLGGANQFLDGRIGKIGALGSGGPAPAHRPFAAPP